MLRHLSSRTSEAAGGITGLYAGVFIGPLMGNVVNVLLPILRHEFAATLGQIGAVVSAYMIPFALLQLVSGTIADRFSRGGTVIAGCAAFALSALLAAVAPTIELFLVARVVQGAANAFVTPVIMATLGDVVPGPRLGRALGLFTTVNTSGLLVAPLLGGALATTNWRLAYLLLTIVSAGLAAYYAWWYSRVYGSLRQSQSPATVGLTTLLRGLAVPRLALLCLAAWLGYLSINGIAFVVALHLEDPLQLGPGASGLVLAGFGLAGIVTAPWGGQAADRWGRRVVVGVGALATAIGTAALAVTPDPWSFGAAYLAAGAAAAVVWAGLNTLAVEAVPAQRAGASSLYNAFKFVGFASAPPLYTPLYAAFGAGPVFLTAGVASLLILAPIGAYRQRPLPATRASARGG